MAYTHENLYFSLTTPLGPDKLLLRSFRGEERLSSLFQFTLELESEDPSIDFSQVVGQGATITLHLADGSDRYIDGVIGRFVQGGSDPTFTRYYAELHPWPWLLTHSADCKIFQEMSVPDIVESVFGDHGFTDFRRSLTGSYSPREYCVQYNETAFDFVSRLFEEEGIFYFFEHAQGKHTLVMADSPSAFAVCPGAASVRYGTRGVWTQQNTLFHLTLEEAVISGAFALDDYNFETPSTDLIASVSSQVARDGASTAASRRVYHYPGRFLKKAAGDALTKLRAEEREAQVRWLRGEGYCRAFLPGFKTTVEDHPRGDVNADYVLARVVHAATWEGYTNSFEALPANTPFRPPLTTRAGHRGNPDCSRRGEVGRGDLDRQVRPHQGALPLGPRGHGRREELLLDPGHPGVGRKELGLLVPAPHRAGGGGLVPGGRPGPASGDRQRLQRRADGALRAARTKQTQGTVKSNAPRAAAASTRSASRTRRARRRSTSRPSRTYNRVVKNNDTLKVGFEVKSAGDQTIDIQNHRTVTLAEGNETFTVKKGNRTVTVETGNESHSVKGTRDVKVTGDETHTDEANFTHTVDKNYKLTVKGDLTIDVTGKVTIKSGGDTLVQSGANLTTKAAQALTDQAGTNLTNKAGSSLTNQAGSSLTNKAGASLTNQAGASLTDKAGASATVQGSASVTVQGAIVKIN